ncbi:hypothetical protein Tco_1131834 [Tanacetum coccineum]|uniref:Reverse transcriptase Ty1/copia-type domain-containing protein n=1 Tax=Tanacetum coccineum TaxID=301880 RepID=A0ABQ5JD93_9ASTR
MLGNVSLRKDLGDSLYVLGIKIYIDRTKRLIGLSQDTYLDKILKRFKMENSKKRNLPLHHGIKISSDLCPKTDDELDKMSRVPYASAIGSIMYAMTCTRPDVSFALSMVSRHQQNPGEGHCTAVKNILSGDMDKIQSKIHGQTPQCESEYDWQLVRLQGSYMDKNFIGDLELFQHT